MITARQALALLREAQPSSTCAVIVSATEVRDAGGGVPALVESSAATAPCVRLAPRRHSTSRRSPAVQPLRQGGGGLV
jgi:hypothetical protein